MWRHRDSKPYSCQFCGFTCIQSTQIKSHYKNKHGMSPADAKKLIRCSMTRNLKCSLFCLHVLIGWRACNLKLMSKDNFLSITCYIIAAQIHVRVKLPLSLSIASLIFILVIELVMVLVHLSCFFTF